MYKMHTNVNPRTKITILTEAISTNGRRPQDSIECAKARPMAQSVRAN